ncbi:thioredoxin family protein [Candidatus Micrarchaeota archaeon]|nr:thioredoxin family protein [Candidatus Micrarchaeota archaeon]
MNKTAILIISLSIIVGLIVTIQLTKSNGGNKPPASNSITSSITNSILGLSSTSSAPELQGIAGYINTPSNLSITSLRGKVVLVDFWTYSCINCIRTLPYVTAWDMKYRDKGLVIIGVHTPEFEFEKNYSNVQAAVAKFGITYPVVLDNDYATWRAFNNRYWPRKYLIDSNGSIRYDHIGEGNYEETEQMIQKLLSERDKSIQMDGLVSQNISSSIASNDFSGLGTPEIYLGYDFARAALGNPEGFQPEQLVNYTYPPSSNSAFQPYSNTVYLNGTWKNNPDNMELASDSGTIILNYKAKNLNIVAGNINGSSSSVSFTLDGRLPIQSELGSDAFFAGNTSTLSRTVVNSERLYSLVYAQNYSQRTIYISVKGKGFRIYTFTFG